VCEVDELPSERSQLPEPHPGVEGRSPERSVACLDQGVEHLGDLGRCIAAGSAGRCSIASAVAMLRALTRSAVQRAAVRRSKRKDPIVTYIMTEPCIDVKDKSCVDVCPVDCIHESDRMLVIDPEECIDCDAWRTRVTPRAWRA
jgi:ferredoxin-like protein FixX